MAEFKLENTKSQMRKGILEYCTLATLSKKEQAYPSEIIKEMKQAKLIVVEGTLYPLLTRLKNSGLLNYSWEESTSGPPRKYYRLTDLGSRMLKELDQSWNELTNSVGEVTKKQSNTTKSIKIDK